MAKLSPLFNSQVFDENGDPAVGWKIYTYAAGSSTAQASFTTTTGDVPHANPIVLNALGLPDNPIWLTEGQRYKFILKDASDVQKGTPLDNISGINDTATTTEEWQDSGLTPTYVSSASYTVPGDQTSALQVGRRQKFTVTSGTVYGRILTCNYNGSSLTTVTLQMDGLQVLDSGLTGVQSSILRNSVLSMPVRAATASGTDTYIASVGIARLVKDDQYQIKIANANTGSTPTLNLDATGAKTIINVDGTALYQGALNGEHVFRFDGANFVVLNPVSGITAQKQIQAISAAVASNALTLTLNPTVLEFRSNTLANGAVNKRTINAAATLVVPSSATLGTVSGQSARLAVLAIDNAGSVELAVSNLAGGVNLDETTLISTTAISAAATSASAIYSTSARVALPFRVVGFIDITEATAGTWATAPTTVQGQGGQALAALQALGIGQTWQDVTASRAAATTYSNTTGKPIQVVVAATVGASAIQVYLTVNGTAIHGNVSYNGAGSICCVSAIIPPAATYSLGGTGAGVSSINKWSELR